MVLNRLKKILKGTGAAEEINHDPSVLIVEDDAEQLDLLVGFVASEVTKLLKDEKTTPEQRKKLTPFNLLRVSELKSLEQAVISNKNVIMALLDCHIPDEQGAPAHDQFVMKDDHTVTGQHRSVDLIAQHLPGTPIMLISSMRRFQKTVIQHYKNDDSLKLEFISKDNRESIKQSIRSRLRQYVEGEN